jgi:cytochrome c5
MNRITRLALPVALVVATSMLVACNNKEEVSKEETATLIAPVAQVDLAGSAPAGAAAAGGAKADPKQTFDTVCAACHSTGAAGAPKVGDKAAWGPRIAQGKDALYKSAINGKNAMPPKGGNPSLSDDDVKAVVDYLVAQAK